MTQPDAIQKVIDHFRLYLKNDNPPLTSHQTSYTWGNIDGLRLALILIENPDFDVKTFRSDFWRDDNKP